MRKHVRWSMMVMAALFLLMLDTTCQADRGNILMGGAGTSEINGTGGQAPTILQDNTQDTATGIVQGIPQNATSDTLQGMPHNTSTLQDASRAMAQSLRMVSCTDSQTDINVARAVVPEGYDVTSETIWCGMIQSPDYPAEVFIDAKSPDGSIELTYESPIEFVQILNASVNGMQFVAHQDYQVNLDYLMMMLTYMNASQYCDYVSQNCMPGTTGMTLISETPVPQETQTLLQQVSWQKMNEANQLLAASDQIYVDLVETTTAEKTYRYTDEAGKAKILVVNCVCQGVRLVEDLSSYGMGNVNITNIIWSVPGRYALMVDEDKYEEGLIVYDSFCNNTTISDQFKKAMADLSQSITAAVTNARASSMSSQAGYVQDTFTSTIGSSDDTYSATEAWDDAILDRNDYTLSSGDSVKVDTSYDYVYELPDGNIYATNSALDEPAGATRLYAN